jgi:hypothetical protein
MFAVSEYDAFGPWIYEVNKDHPLPPLFVPYYREENDCLMMIKIPRNIERRNARPDMDLYDYVIGLYEDHIVILKRVGKDVEESKAFYRDIVGIEDHRRLLKGTLTIFLNHGKLVIPYNTVSSAVLIKFIGMIREKYAQKFLQLKGNFYSDEALPVEVLYRNMLRDIKSFIQDIQICAVQSSIPLRLAKGNIAEKIGIFLSRPILLNSLHLTNKKELIIFTRGRTFIKRGKANYDFSTIYIPFEKLFSVTIENDDRYSGLSIITLKLTDQEFKFYFEQANQRSISFYSDIKSARLFHRG